MSAIERVSTTLGHQEPDRVPFLLPTIVQGARELGLSIEDYFSRADNVVQGQLRLRHKLGHDGLFGFMYAAQEVEAWGGSVIYREDGPPNAGAPPLKAAQISGLEPPDVSACPALCRVLEVIRALKQRVGDGAPILGVSISPFSLPVLQLGFEAYLDLMYDQPDLHRRLLQVNEEFCVAWSNAQLAAGATAISYTDPVSSPGMVPRGMYLALGMPSARRTLARLNGPAATGFASAPCLPIIEQVISTGTVGVSASVNEDLGQLKAACAGKVTVMGNLNAIQMTGWTAAETERQIKACIAAAAPGGGYVLTDNHGEIPWQVSDEALLAVGEAVRRWGRYPIDWLDDAHG